LRSCRHDPRGGGRERVAQDARYQPHSTQRHAPLVKRRGVHGGGAAGAHLRGGPLPKFDRGWLVYGAKSRSIGCAPLHAADKLYRIEVNAIFSGLLTIRQRFGLERLRLQARVWEAETEAWLDHMGPITGWRCLDLGCGAMGILGPL